MATLGDAPMGEAPTPVANEKREGSPMEQPQEKRRKAAAVLTWNELRKMDYNKMNPEEKAQYNEEFLKDERLRHPWWDETDKLWSEPPDINYRALILDDQEMIDRLLADWNLHFTERCLRYQGYDTLLEDNVLFEYLSWAEEMRGAASGGQDEERKKFFRDLRHNIREDWKQVKTENYRNHHEELLREATENLQKDGPRQLYSYWGEGWYYWDQVQGEWHKEPSENGSEYSLRREQWRKGALSKVVQRYYDCAEHRFYCYSSKEERWQAEQETYDPFDGGYFQYDKAKGQWYAPDWLLEINKGRVDEHEAIDPESLAPLAEDAGCENSDSKNHSPVIEDPASPSPSVDMQAEVDAQLATNLHDTASP